MSGPRLGALSNNRWFGVFGHAESIFLHFFRIMVIGVFIFFIGDFFWDEDSLFSLLTIPRLRIIFVITTFLFLFSLLVKWSKQIFWHSSRLLGRVADLDMWWKPAFALLSNQFHIKGVDIHSKIANLVNNFPFKHFFHWKIYSLFRSKLLLLVWISSSGYIFQKSLVALLYRRLSKKSQMTNSSLIYNHTFYIPFGIFSL